MRLTLPVTSSAAEASSSAMQIQVARSSRPSEAVRGAHTPLYASPELFQGTLSRHCDQYSLAIVFQELLTGTLPFAGRNSRQLLVQHMQAEPNLDELSPGDRPIIARALAHTSASTSRFM